MKPWFVLALVPLAGCAASLVPIASTALDAGTAVGPASSAASTQFNSIASKITGFFSEIDDVVMQRLLQKAAALHNLQVGLQQINAAQGMVSTAPTIGTTMPAPGPSPPTTSPPATLP